MDSILGWSTDHLLCENLLSFGPATIFLCQPVTISLIANTAEDCRPAFVKHWWSFKACSSLPTVKWYLIKESMNLYFYFVSMRLDLIVPRWWKETWLRDYYTVEAGWHVRGKAQCTENAETVDKSLPPAQQKKKPAVPLPRHMRGKGGSTPSLDDVWCGP